MTDTNAMREAVARCIIGPRRPVPAGCRWTLEELRAVRWNHATPSERADALSAADAILALLATDRAAGVGELRGALIDMGRQIGCALSDEVSTEFLTNMLPEELRLWREANASPPAPADASGEDYALPCDVHLPPTTVIKAGCTLATLKIAMEAPHRLRSFDSPARTAGAKP